MGVKVVERVDKVFVCEIPAVELVPIAVEDHYIKIVDARFIRPAGLGPGRDVNFVAFGISEANVKGNRGAFGIVVFHIDSFLLYRTGKSSEQAECYSYAGK